MRERENLNYSQLKEELITFLSKNKTLVLASCADNRVTARTMSIIHDGIVIYFQTDKEFLKYQQIEKNPNVALCAGNVQIEGRATIMGHPLGNFSFQENFRIHHQSSFMKYSHLKDEVIIEVEPRLITFWKYTDEQVPYRDFLNIPQEKAYREYYRKKS
jgi:uncharacterized pyridoxamine 5'-phosphate oxidase family protein